MSPLWREQPGADDISNEIFINCVDALSHLIHAISRLLLLLLLLLQLLLLLLQLLLCFYTITTVYVLFRVRQLSLNYGIWIIFDVLFYVTNEWRFVVWSVVQIQWYIYIIYWHNDYIYIAIKYYLLNTLFKQLTNVRYYYANIRCPQSWSWSLCHSHYTTFD